MTEGNYPVDCKTPEQNYRGNKILRASLAVVFVALLAPAAYWLYSKSEQHEMAERTKLAKDDKQDISMVQMSVAVSRSIMARAAKEFLGEEVKIGDCEWHVRPMWNGSYNNPNWFSQTEGITEYHVTCIAEIEYNGGPEDFQFEWDVDPEGRGVTSFRWGWNWSRLPPLDQ